MRKFMGQFMKSFITNWIFASIYWIRVLFFKHWRVLFYVYAFIFPLVLFLALESLNPASSDGLFNGIRDSLGAILFSSFLIACLAFFIFLPTRSVLISFGIVSLFLLTFYITNYFKLVITGGFFVPTDLLVAASAFEVMAGDEIKITFLLVLRVLFVILLHVPLAFVKFSMALKKRMITLTIYTLVFVLFLSGGFALNSVLPAFGLDEGSVSDRYRDKGFVLGFYTELILYFNKSDTDFSIDDRPPFFNTGDNNDPAGTDPDPAGDEKIMPNVIVIMSEAFFDPTIFDNITYSRDPVPNFRRLTEAHTGGNVIIPSYGGGTANTEFEFLAGSPHIFMGSRYYIHYEDLDRIHYREIPTALPWLFRDNGYRSIALHTFGSVYFNRDTIYPQIGFEEFITDEMMPDAVYFGPYISDEYFTDELIGQIIKAEDLDTPLFLFGITMQNHWGYDAMKYETTELEVMSDSPYLEPEEIERINTFLQGIYDADRQLGRLVDFIESRDTPTILVFFGDHMPIMGKHADRVYEKLGFVSKQEEYNWHLNDLINIFRTPYLIWTNYDTGHEVSGDLASYILGARIAEMAGINLNRYFNLLLDIHKDFRAVTNQVSLTMDGDYYPGMHFMTHPDIVNLEYLWRANLFGDDDFYRSLSDLIR